LLSLPARIISKEASDALFLARMTRVLFGVGTIMMIYFLAKEFYDGETALIATLLISIFPSHIYLSRTAVAYPVATFFCTLSLYLLNKFSLTKKEKFLYLFSFSSSIGILIHMSTGLFFLSLLPFFIFLKSKLTIKLLLISFLIGLVITYPTLKIIPNEYPKGHPYGHVNLLDIKGNLLYGFLSFFNFLGGDIGYTYVYNSSYYTYAFPWIVPLLMFFLFLIKRKEEKSIVLFTSFLIGFIAISTLTITEFRPVTFHILIPFLFLAMAKGISFFMNS
jgi:4-amino-4-deoxy-L-arabinose transferase-like glycosyltransferase